MKFISFKYCYIILLLILLSQIGAKKPKENTNKTKTTEKYISYFLNSTIPSVTDDNFDKIIRGGYPTDCIVLFTVKRCTICNDIIKTIEEVSSYYSEEHLKFYKLDIVTSGWTSMRFELERLPNIIYVSKGNYSIYPLSNLTVNDVKEFIEDKNKILMKLPKKVGYWHLIKKIFKIFSYILSQKFPFWNEDNYWILIIVFITFFCFVEYLIIKFCCPTRKNKNKKYEHIHEDEDNEYQHGHKGHINKKNKSKNE